MPPSARLRRQQAIGATRHLPSNVAVTIDSPVAASGIVDLEVLHQDDARWVVRSVPRYLDRHMRTDAGGRFADRTIRPRRGGRAPPAIFPNGPRRGPERTARTSAAPASNSPAFGLVLPDA